MVATRRFAGENGAAADLGRLEGTVPALSEKIATLTAICQRHEATLEALLEALVELREANSALRAQNASLRSRSGVSMVERVRAAPRGRARPSFDADGTAP